MGRQKERVITFKVDEELAEVISRLPNRSAFIRKAILESLGNVCPLCQGQGTLTPEQMAHWEAFSRHHAVKSCEVCNALYLSCDHESGGKS